MKQGPIYIYISSASHYRALSSFKRRFLHTNMPSLVTPKFCCCLMARAVLWPQIVYLTWHLATRQYQTVWYTFMRYTFRRFGALPTTDYELT